MSYEKYVPDEQFYCWDHCVAHPDAKGDVTSCIYCGKELIKINGQWYTWDCDFHPKQKPQN